MGLVKSVAVADGHARVELLLTTGWCQFASRVIDGVERGSLYAAGVTSAEAAVVWDEAWTTAAQPVGGAQAALPSRSDISSGPRRIRCGAPDTISTGRGGKPMLGDAFVFDGVAHPFNFTPKNAFGRPGEMFSNHLYAFHSALTPDSATTLSAEEFLKDWTPADIHQMVFDESDVDMLVAMPLPLTDLYRDGLSPWEECAELASRDPDRTVFWGSVNPLKAATDLMGVGQRFARRLKFYNVRFDYGQPFPWRMDDPRIAFPSVRRRRLGINLIGVHEVRSTVPIEHAEPGT
jgi:hypothetical protein